MGISNTDKIIILDTLPKANNKANIKPNGSEINNNNIVLSKPDKTKKKFLKIRESEKLLKNSITLKILLNNLPLKI